MGPRITRIGPRISRIGTNWSTNFTNLHELKRREAHFSKRRVGEGVLGDVGVDGGIGVRSLWSVFGDVFLRCVF